LQKGLGHGQRQPFRKDVREGLLASDSVGRRTNGKEARGLGGLKTLKGPGHGSMSKQKQVSTVIFLPDRGVLVGREETVGLRMDQRREERIKGRTVAVPKAKPLYANKRCRALKSIPSWKTV